MMLFTLYYQILNNFIILSVAETNSITVCLVQPNQKKTLKFISTG